MRAQIDVIVCRQTALELLGDDRAGQFHRLWLDAECRMHLIDDGVVNLLPVRRTDRLAGIEERNLAQQRVFRRAARRAVDDAYLVAELADDARQHPRVGRNAGAAFERQVEAVEIDAPAHRLLLLSVAMRGAANAIPGPVATRSLRVAIARVAIIVTRAHAVQSEAAAAAGERLGARRFSWTGFAGLAEIGQPAFQPPAIQPARAASSA